MPPATHPRAQMVHRACTSACSAARPWAALVVLARASEGEIFCFKLALMGHLTHLHFLSTETSKTDSLKAVLIYEILAEAKILQWAVVVAVAWAVPCPALVPAL